MTAILGIDPGAHGAIALIVDGSLVEMADMPADKVLTGRTKRTRVNAPVLANLIHSLTDAFGGRDIQVFIENVGSLPKQGIASTFAFGKACGLVEGVVAACGLPYTMVTPQTWKKAVGIPKGDDKSASRRRAGQLFPSSYFVRVKDDGRADAALIAYYGSQHYGSFNGRPTPDRKPGRRVQVAPVRRTRRVLAA